MRVILERAKITKERAGQIYNERGLTLLEPYRNSKYKHSCEDKNGYRYSLSLGSVKDKRTGAFAKHSKYNCWTIYNLKKFIKENNLRCNLLEDDNKIIKEKEKLRFTCGICGEEYLMHYNHLLMNKKDTCNKCSYEAFAKTHTFTIEDYKVLLSGTGYSLIEGVAQSYRKVYIQDKEGYKYEATLPNICQGTTPIKFHKHNPYTIENMKRYLKEQDIPVALLESDDKKYFDVRTTCLQFACIECGKVYKALWGEVIDRQRYRCSKCAKTQSKYEYYVERYLIEKGIEYIKQKRFDDCRNIKPLPFDFYLPQHNYIIEVHGSQHYYENVIFQETLEHRQYIDKLKENYCHNNNIGFVAIPYWQIVNKHNVKRYKITIDNIAN